MSYTLAKWALWLIGAALIGGIVGWLLRGVRGLHGAVGASDATALDDDELETLRDRVAELEPLITERERLRIQLEDCRQTIAETRHAVAKNPPLPTRQPASAAGLAALAADSSVVVERDRLAALVGTHEATIGDLRARLWNQEARLGELQGQLAVHFADTAPPAPDLDAAARTLGEKVRLNDLTVVEGIGPKIADALMVAGIRTWWQLHQTEVAVLERVLAEAGPRFQVHDPSSWPQQAGLLARGDWQAFKTLADQLRGGKLQG